MGKIIIKEETSVATPVGTGKHTIYVDSVSGKIKKKDSAGAEKIIATEDSLAYASTAEVLTGTETAKIVNPKTLKDVYEKKSNNLIINRTTSTVTESVTYAHGLGVIPKIIQFSVVYNGQYGFREHSIGSYTSIGGNKSLYYITTSNEGGHGSSSTHSIYFYYSSTNYIKGRVTSVTDTNITIEWTQAMNNISGTISILATISN